MVNISKYIYDYLMEYNTPVIVPELGCFTVINKPSEIRDGVIFPPVKTVELDSEKTEDDHVFTLFIAKKENKSIEQVVEEIKTFYNQNFKTKLTPTNSVSFEHFGTFSLDDAKNIIFKPDNDFFKDYYGLGYSYFHGNVPPQPAATLAEPEPIPEPVPVPEPVFVPFPEPEPIKEPEPVPPPAPAQPVFDMPPAEEKKEKRPPSEDSLFNTSDGKTYRVTPEPKRPEPPKQEPPRPPKPAAKAPSPPKKKQKQLKSSSSNLWLLWLLIAAVGLGVAFYFLYPILDPILFPKGTTITVLNAEPEEDYVSAAEPEEDTPNAELAQTLDDATDKKNALKPEVSQPQATSASPPNQTSVSSETKPSTVVPSQGEGKYVLIIASFTTQAAAEKHVRKVQADGLTCEIIDAGNQRFRVSVASFDVLSEATRQANLMKSKPHCENVWVIRR